MMRRLPGTARRRVVRVRTRAASGVRRHVQHWVKALYNSADRAAAPEWKSLDWVSDGPPSRRPTYAVGDELLLYDVPSRSFPARARVTAEAVSRPRLVDREGGPGEGRRWPFVTEVEVLGAV